MTRGERIRVRGLLGDLWTPYKNRVEVLRKEHENGGMSVKDATCCWDEALKEEPYASAALGDKSIATSINGVPVFDDNGHLTVLPAPAVPDRPADQDHTEAQGIEQSNREDMAWVAANLHKADLKRKDAPNDAAHNLYLWVQAGDADAFWHRYLQIASTKEGQSTDRMADDGREALETVDSVLDKDPGGAERAEEPQPQPAGAA